jgi:ABC-2 type transport system permease protein
VVITTWRRELMSYLFSPVGYVIAVLLYVYRGFEISALVELIALFGGDRDQFATLYVFQLSSYFVMVLVPAILTMRCFAEERRSGSLEVLMTAPVRSWEIVLGKWGAAFTFFVLLLGPMVLLLWLLQGDGHLGVELALGPSLSGYLGIALVGSLLLSVGCFTSSLTDNQLLASLSAMLLSAALLAGPGLLAPYMNEVLERGELVRALVGQISVNDHLSDWFARGLVDSGHIVFYVSGTVYFLFLTTLSLEARRWR